MKILFLSFLFLSCISFSSCKDGKDDAEPSTGVYVNQSVNIRIKSSEGIDLLNPQNEGAITRFKVYYLENGEKKLFSEPNLDASGGYSIEHDQSTKDFYVKVLMDANKTSFEATTYLQVGDDNTNLETIKTQYKPVTNATIPEKIWLNGILSWTTSARTMPSLEIIKP